MENKIGRYDFYAKVGFMVSDLELKGTELELYAIIYSFSKDGIHSYEGSQQYLCNWTNRGKSAIQSALNNLVEKELIFKEEYFTNNVKYCKYKVNLNKLQFDDGYYENHNTGVKSTVNNIYNNYNNTNTNNNYNNNSNNSDIENKKATNDIDVIEELFNKYTENDDLYNVLLDFADYRKKEKKKPLTERSANMILNKLNTLKNDKDKIECLQTSIMNGWTGIFPQENNKPTRKNQHDEGDLKSSIDTSHRRRRDENGNAIPKS